MNRLPEYCPEGQFARGFQLKTDHPGFLRQRSGVEIVKFFCGPIGAAVIDNNTITSEQGRLGDWGKQYICDNGQVIKSVQVLEDDNPCRDHLFSGTVFSIYRNIIF